MDIRQVDQLLYDIIVEDMKAQGTWPKEPTRPAPVKQESQPPFSTGLEPTERNPMTTNEQILNVIEKQNQIRESASAFLDPNNAGIVRRHMAEEDHRQFEAAKAQQAKDLRDQGRITEQLHREGFSEPRNMMRESDRDFHNRLQEAERRRDPLSNLTRSEAAAVTAARSALTLTE
jgi:hypothetical protein